MELTRVDQIVQEYDRQASWLALILQDIHRECGALPEPALKRVAQHLQLAPRHVDDVARFYAKYGLEQLSRALTTFSIDDEVCKGCGMCRRKCPVEAVTGVQKGHHEIDPDKCVRCGLCRDNCRLGAVVVTWHSDREFVRCDVCGQPLATDKELELLQNVLRANPNMAPYCPTCQRSKMASRLASATAIRPTGHQSAAESASEEIY
jgi:ferredoxin